jgi:hypothetical protein
MDEQTYKMLQELYDLISPKEGQDKKLDANDIAYMSGILKTILTLHAQIITEEPREPGLIDRAKHRFGV